MENQQVFLNSCLVEARNIFLVGRHVHFRIHFRSVRSRSFDVSEVLKKQC